MSYRELRNFTEMLRGLGYDRKVSVDSFRKPNLPLTMDCLAWLIKRYEPDVDLPRSVQGEAQTIDVLKRACSSMASKDRIKLNAKRLYQADGYAVKELLKIASILYNAMSSNDDDDDMMAEEALDTTNLEVGEIKSVRDVANEITKLSANLYELLGKEEMLRGERERAISANPDLSAIESSVRAKLQQLNDEMQSLERHIEQLKGDVRSKDDKIERKRLDLERQEKRLKSLQSVRPAYMDEYEKLEEEMHMLFRQYLERHRNLDYIQGRVKQYESRERERMDDRDRRMREVLEKLKQDELDMMRGHSLITDEALQDGLYDDVGSGSSSDEGGSSLSGSGSDDDDQDDDDSLADDGDDGIDDDSGSSSDGF